MKTLTRALIAINGVACGFNLALLLVPGYQALNIASATISAVTIMFQINMSRLGDR